MKDLLPAWGWACFALLFAGCGLVIVLLGKSVIDDSCTVQRYLCPDSNHAF